MGLAKEARAKKAPEMDVSKRICKVCGKERDLESFRLGPSGRLKTICAQCVKALTLERWGEKGTRNCVTCGKVTMNYRCARCWSVRREDCDATGLDPNYLPGAPLQIKKRKSNALDI